MMKRQLAAGLLILVCAGCTRIETGEVGLRKGFDKRIDSEELLPGSFNQTLIGSVLTFPVKEITLHVDDLSPMSKDNSAMKEFDISVIYNVAPSAVSDLYTQKSMSFHEVNDGDIYLMANYITRLVRNAAYKEARNYESLTMNDNRATIEGNIQKTLEDMLAAEKLESAINVSQVLVRKIQPADVVVQSANELVRAKNENAKKEIEVQIAEKEARRIAALNANKGAIDYMNAQANMAIAEGVRDGKVKAIVVPHDFKGIVQVVPN